MPSSSVERLNIIMVFILRKLINHNLSGVFMDLGRLMLKLLQVNKRQKRARMGLNMGGTAQDRGACVGERNFRIIFLRNYTVLCHIFPVFF